MKFIKNNLICKIHLIISVVVVVPAAFIYGFIPEAIFDIHPHTTDEYNILKAVMSLYLGFSALWLLGMFNKSYLKSALITNAVFMLALACGRLLSFAFDGIPTFLYVFGTFAELFLGIYGVWVLRYLKKMHG
jgi:hypothetical protein